MSFKSNKGRVPKFQKMTNWLSAILKNTQYFCFYSNPTMQKTNDVMSSIVIAGFKNSLSLCCKPAIVPSTDSSYTPCPERWRWQWWWWWLCWRWKLPAVFLLHEAGVQVGLVVRPAHRVQAAMEIFLVVILVILEMMMLVMVNLTHWES